MRYLLAILCPPAIVVFMPGKRSMEIKLISVFAGLAFVFFAAQGLKGWLLLPFVLPMLWAWAAVVACLEVSDFYREQKVQIIAEAVQRAAHEPTKEPEAPAMKLPMPANYDPSRDVYKL